jgi:hypothetical protein
MSYSDVFGLRTITVSSATVDTSADLLGSATKRSGVKVANPSATPLYLKYVKRGASAPAIGATDFHDVVTEDSIFLPFSEAIGVYGYAATAITVNVVEVGY